MTAEETAASRVAWVLRRSTRQVRWRSDAPGGHALVVHAPWARVIVARTAGAASRWADAWQAEARGGDLLWQSLVALYPVEVTPWASPAELTDTPLPSKVRGLLQWAVRAEGWPVTPRFFVVGSWASWPDAVLVRETGGDFVCQVPAAELAQLD